MRTPEASHPHHQFSLEPADDEQAAVSSAETEVPQEELKAVVGNVVTVEFLDTHTTTQFLITREEREREELPAEVQALLPPGVKLARVATPLARVVMGRTASDEILELIVQRSRPLKILEVSSLVS